MVSITRGSRAVPSISSGPDKCIQYKIYNVTFHHLLRLSHFAYFLPGLFTCDHFVGKLLDFPLRSLKCIFFLYSHLILEIVF